MTPEFDRQVVVITGGAGGIGRSLCSHFEQLGADVISFDLAHADWPASTSRIIGIDVDLGCEASVERAVDAVAKRFGRIDCLINNAGHFRVARRPFWEIDLAEWDEVVGLNVRMAFLCSRAVTRFMREHRSGRVVNIASGTVVSGVPNLLHYVAAKAALLGMTRSMASELGAFGITVNAISPGLVPTDAGRASASPEIFDLVLANQKLKHHLAPDDIASAAAYLCSPGARSITGQNLIVSCGDSYGGF